MFILLYFKRFKFTLEHFVCAFYFLRKKKSMTLPMTVISWNNQYQNVLLFFSNVLEIFT